MSLYKISKRYISNVIANYKKLKLPGFNDAQITKKQYVHTTAATSTSASTVNNYAINTNTTTVAIIANMPKSMKMNFSRNFDVGK